MSGHSKWSTIKRAKGVADAKRGALFGKLAKKISVAVKEGGSADPTFNSRLRLEIDQAKSAGMPNDNIERAVKRGLGQTTESALEQINYEAYGPGGSAFYIETITDNRNRTAQSIKTILNKNGGSLGAQGSVVWQFQKNETGEMICTTPLELNEQDTEKAFLLFSLLEDNDDVTAVYSNIK